MPAAPFPYYGGKSRLAEWVISHFPPHACYVEPFGGSAAVLLRKDPAAAEVYNDRNLWVVNFFRVLQDPVMREELKDRLSVTCYSRAVFERERRRIAAGEPAGPPSVEAAWAFFVVARASYSGHVGIKRTPSFASSPSSRRGRAITVSRFLSSIDGLAPVAARLRDCVIECVDAIHCIRLYDRPDTLFYIDPPYLETRVDEAYYHSVDHDALVAVLTDIRGMAVVSNYPNAVYERLESNGWVRVDRSYSRYAGNGRRTPTRPETTESLWINPACQRALDDSLLELFR